MEPVRLTILVFVKALITILTLALCATPALSRAGSLQVDPSPPGIIAPCPGRVDVIEEVEHPTVPITQSQTWAYQTQQQVAGCVRDGTISPDYGYLLNVKIMARVVRYVCIIGDSMQSRQVLAAFDASILEGRPLLLSNFFASQVESVSRDLHTDCPKGGI